MDKGSFKMITKLTQDTIPPFKFAATKKQFANFINSGGFKATERFVKQVQTKKPNTRRWASWNVRLFYLNMKMVVMSNCPAPMKSNFVRTQTQPSFQMGFYKYLNNAGFIGEKTY